MAARYVLCCAAMRNHYAAPRAHRVADAASSGRQLRDAALDRRFGSAVIDIVFVLLIGGTLSAASAAAFGAPRDGGWAIAGIFVPLVVNWYFTAARGQSVGKLATNTRIARLDGSVPGFLHGVVLRVWLFVIVAVLLRVVAPKELARVLPAALALLDVAFVFGAGSRCLHDRVAGTRVIDLRWSR